MKKRLLIIAGIIFVFVIIPIAVFQTIKLATRPASISLEEARSLPLEEGQEIYTTAYEPTYGWGACTICLDLDDTDWVKGCANLVISNDFYIRHFQDLEMTYVIIVHDTGKENRSGFHIVVADAWYVLEEADE